MIALKQIVCAVDFSECSRHAIHHAQAMAARYGGAITALHVIPGVGPLPAFSEAFYPPIPYTADDLAQFRAETARFVEQESGSVPLDCVVVEGNAAAEIVRIAQQLLADIIVIGSHGRTGFQRLLLGSVAERVLRTAPCPVLTVPRRAPDTVPSGPVTFTRILSAIDFSPSSMKALTYAASFADQADAELTAVHVLELLPSFEPVVIGVPGEEDYRTLAQAAARARLHEALVGRLASSHGIREIVTTGKPYQEILRLAEEQRTELIVMGVHGGAAGLSAFGSATNQIVRHATCPVLSLSA